MWLKLLIPILIYTSVWSFDVQHLKFKDSSPKCCAQNEILSLNVTDDGFVYNCTSAKAEAYTLLTKETLLDIWDYTEENVSCIDGVFNKYKKIVDTVKLNRELNKVAILNVLHFPKCCPTDALYDSYEHKCVRHNHSSNFLFSKKENFSEYLQNGFFAFRIGMGFCEKPVVDYEFPSYKDMLFTKGRGLLIDVLNGIAPYGNYCIDKVYDSDNFIARVCHENFEVCKSSRTDEENIRCIRKCCPDGSWYKGSGTCTSEYGRGLNFENNSKITNADEPFAIIHGIQCAKYPASFLNYTIDEMGNLQMIDDGSLHTPFKHTYCFEHVEKGTMQGTHLFHCKLHKDRNPIEFEITRVALLLSVVCLLLTLMGYIFLPEMQNLHGKTLMCHCGNLLAAFLFLSILQFNPNLDELACRAAAYLNMYLFLSAFMWSNIMCFDIWWTFGSLRVHGIDHKTREFKRFLWYCLYGWSIPFLVITVTYLIQHFEESMPKEMMPFVPRLGKYNCFFDQEKNWQAFLVWFMVPIFVVTVCNTVLFVKTMMYCYKVKGEIARMKDTEVRKKDRKRALSVDTERMKMAAKLFLVMGIPWIFEGISMSTIPVPAEGAAAIVQITFDTINSLTGVFIFCIFVLKIKFLRALKRRLGMKYTRRTSQSTTSALTVTTSVNIRRLS